MSAWRPCCGDCGFEHLQEAEGHPLYCGRCGAAWDGSEVWPQRGGLAIPNGHRWWFLHRYEGRGGSAEFREWVEMVVSG